MLTQEQIKSYERDGYLVVPEVLPADLLQRVKTEYSDLMEQLYNRWYDAGSVALQPDTLDFWGKLLEAYKAGCDWFQPMDISLPGDEIEPDTPFHFGPAVFDLLTEPRLLDHVEALIGPEITSNPIQHVRIKPPATDLHQDEVRAHITATDWHQDRAVALAEADATQMVTVWIAITDATLENGCLQVQPKAQGQEILPHCPQRQTGIAEGFVDESQAMPLPIGAGGIIVLHPLTPHASLTNQTDGFRWSFDIRYNVSGEPTGRSHFPAFVARSRAHPATELKDWRIWKTMWEQARARLSAAPHVPIHRWTSDAPFCA